MSNPLSHSLGQFWRYQRALMYGGGALVTFAITAALIIHVVYTIQHYVARERQDLAVELRRIADETAQTEASLRNHALYADIAWDRGSPVAEGLVRQFRAQGDSLVLPGQTPLLIVGAKAGTAPSERITKFIGLATQMAPLLSVITQRRGAPLAAYAVASDASLAIISPAAWPNTTQLTKLLDDRAMLFRYLTAQLPLPSSLHPNGPSATQWGRPVTWLGPVLDPFVGEPMIRVVTATGDDKRTPLFFG
ncbi:hypothetical protein, partial [Burkholderia humptydooensis]|uniref:hypothetical protein n=1 Tax=Burkholderia humptydooensis TaxID=430531 RepID=UPI0012FE3E44